MSLATVALVLAALWPGHLAIGAARPPGEVPALDARYQYRDAGFRQHILGDQGRSRWDADDFHRPLGLR